jgi:hypothetical protein
MSAPPTPLQERTKGGDPTSIVLVKGVITTEINRAAVVHRCHCSVHPKTQEHKSILGDWLGHRRASLHSQWLDQEEPM